MKTEKEIRDRIKEVKKELANTYLDDVKRFCRGELDELLFALGSNKKYYDVEK